MAKVKVVNNNLDQNVNGNNFNNTASQTIFSFGSFSVTSNFDGRKYIDYNNVLSSFVREVTLDTMGITDIQSEIIHEYNTNAVLNLDKSDLNTFIRFGSAYEFLRTSIENIITKYPASLFMSSQISRNNNVTYLNYMYDIVSDTSTFDIPTNCIINTFGLSYNYGNVALPENMEIKNINISYDKYIIWTNLNPTNNSSNILGYTGNTSGRKYLTIKAKGNPFSMVSGVTTARVDFHIKPNNFIFEEFRSLLNSYETYILSTRINNDGFQFTIKDPTLLDDGNIIYADSTLLWTTSDKYNIDINTGSYQKFLEILLTIGAKYDKIKTDLISRFLTPASIKAYDLTDEGKMTKLLRIYGREFDQIREFIDSLVYINRVSYDKINNIPDQLIKNLSQTFGWDYFSLINEEELVNTFLTIDDNERDLNTDLLPAEIDIELWRRILMNTNYFWKSKGTRESIKAMFLLIGIPEPFVNITEYVYTVDGKINPNTVPLTINDFPTNSLPYDTEGYPIAPLETSDFFFQISGNTDHGQRYLDVFRMAGFNLTRTVDNKKTWPQSGATYRIDDTTPQYYQEDSKLVINTKEIDIALDTARGIEYDVYDYAKTDFAANATGYTLAHSYVNISLGVSASQNTFMLPDNPQKTKGDFEVRFNGILLNAPKTGTTTGITNHADYTIDYSTNTFTLANGVYAKNSGLRRDVIQATYVYSGATSSLSGITVQYIVTRVKANTNGTVVPLPSYPRGDVQVTINGIALTKGTPQFTADYIVDPNNTTGSSQIIIQNLALISYLQVESEIQVAYIEVTGSNNISARNEILRVDSFNGSKIYFNGSANKYVYKLNYKTKNAADIKILIDGIALEPNIDYSLNTQNPYEIFLPRGIKYGTIISVYYLVGENEYFDSIIGTIFGIGDISNLSFLEFIELIQRRLINARNRKTISDFKGGWYPTLLKVYIEYLKRSKLSPDDPLYSNGYTFQNLYSFLGKYNAFFQRFVDQLLSATIIYRGGGLMIRNTVFNKQKFMYRRGVNLYSTGSTTIDMRNNPMLQYLGDDGSVFLINNTEPDLYVDTVVGTLGSIITGGENIIGNNILTEYGIVYSAATSISWEKLKSYGTLPVDFFDKTITPTIADTNYKYAAYVKSGNYGYTGRTLEIKTLDAPSLLTWIGCAGVYSIDNTGGYEIHCYSDVDYYGMQYKKNCDNSWTTVPDPLTPGPLLMANYGQYIYSLSANTKYDYRAYMTIGIDSYCGNCLSLTTLEASIPVPTVTTGNAVGVTYNCMCVHDNVVNDDGGVSITEYGVLYTQNPSYGTPTALIYCNQPTNVSMKSIAADININDPFFVGSTCEILPLLSDTTTYYRAFAENSSGYGYGCVCIQQTEPYPTNPVRIQLTKTNTISTHESEGIINTNPPLLVNQCVCFDINIEQTTTDFAKTITQIWCQPDGIVGYNEIFCKCYDGIGVNCDTSSISLCCGDLVCYYHSNNGASGSWSTIALNSIISHTVDIDPLICNTLYCDRIETY